MKKIFFIFSLLFFVPSAFADEAPVQIGRAGVTRMVTTAQPAAQSVQTAQTAQHVNSNTVAARTTSTTATRTNASEPAAQPDTTTQSPAIGRTAVTSVAAARIAAGESGENTRTTVVRAVGGQPIQPSRAAISRSAITTAVQSDERQAEYNSFNTNDKGVANNSPTLRRAGVALRPTVAEVGGRATISGSDKMTGSNIGSESGRVATRTDRSAGVRPTAASIAETRETLSATLELGQACQEQFMDCMDQFCAVLDANQKRCSCSSRLNSYSRVESAVKTANNELNEVAQRIRFVGLSADEIRAIMSATEAEMAMQGQRDTTENRNMLTQIEKLIRTPENFVSEATGTSLDMEFDFNFDGDFSEMFSLEGIFGGGSSFSNMRGTQLYNAAKSRCNNVLNTCKKNGANVSQITARYDMEIDKDCIAYEKGLEKMNQTLKTNVRAATQMLQQARLAVMQNHNSFDGKGCIGALERCMIDDMVCGDDYIKCLDPSKRFIDENGEVVLGQDIVMIRQFMKEFNAAVIDSKHLGDVDQVSTLMNDSYCSGTPGNDGRCIVKFLLQKIGTGEAPTSGLCRAVLDRCRQHTYTDNRGKYQKYNNIVVGYIQRAMVNIKAAQERIISDYASNCMLDIGHCYSQQVTQVSSWAHNANINSIYNVMTGACRNVALTCGFAVFSAVDPTIGCRTAEGSNGTVATECIKKISELFYQSMLCPENSTYIAVTGIKGELASVTLNGISQHRPYINEQCICDDGYGLFGGACVTPPMYSIADNSCSKMSLINSPTVASGKCVVIGYACQSSYKPTNDGRCITE